MCFTFPEIFFLVVAFVKDTEKNEIYLRLVKAQSIEFYYI